MTDTVKKSVLTLKVREEGGWNLYHYTDFSASPNPHDTWIMGHTAYPIKLDPRDGVYQYEDAAHMVINPAYVIMWHIDENVDVQIRKRP